MSTDQQLMDRQHLDCKKTHLFHFRTPCLISHWPMQYSNPSHESEQTPKLSGDSKHKFKLEGPVRQNPMTGDDSLRN